MSTKDKLLNLAADLVANKAGIKKTIRGELVIVREAAIDIISASCLVVRSIDLKNKETKGIDTLGGEMAALRVLREF